MLNTKYTNRKIGILGLSAAVLITLVLLFILKPNKENAEAPARHLSKQELHWKTNRTQTNQEELRDNVNQENVIINESYPNIYEDTQNTVYQYLDENSFKEAYTEISNKQSLLPPAEFNLFQMKILSQWAQTSPEVVTNLLPSISSPTARSSILSNIAEGWAKIDLEKAFDWLVQCEADGYFQSKSELTNSYLSIMSEYAKHSPIVAAEIIGQNKSKDIQLTLIDIAVREYVKINPTESVSWLMTLENPDVRKKGLMQILKNPSEAQVEAVLKHHQKLSPYTASLAIKATAENNMDKAAQQLSTLDINKQTLIIDGLVRDWMDKDMESVEKWVTQLPSPTLHDLATEAIVKKLAHYEPNRAITHALALFDSQKRYDSIQNIIVTTKAENLHLLKTLITDSKFSDEIRTDFVAKIDQRLQNEYSELIIPEF